MSRAVALDDGVWGVELACPRPDCGADLEIAQIHGTLATPVRCDICLHEFTPDERETLAREAMTLIDNYDGAPAT